MKATLVRACAKSQEKHEANEMLNELNELSKQQYVSAYEVATIYVALGNNEQAFQLLEKGYAEHSFHLVYLNVSPQFKPIRSDRRFQDLVQRIGLSSNYGERSPPSGGPATEWKRGYSVAVVEKIPGEISSEF
jgi:hypothetical protein